MAAAATVGLLLGALAIRRLLHTRLIAGQPDSALAMPAAAVRDTLVKALAGIEAPPVADERAARVGRVAPSGLS